MHHIPSRGGGEQVPNEGYLLPLHRKTEMWAAGGLAGGPYFEKRNEVICFFSVFYFTF